MAVTEKDLLLYDAMPWTRDAWASPCHSYPLVATRYRDGDSCGSHPHTWDAAPGTGMGTPAGAIPGWCIRAQAAARPRWAPS